jgi:hypothetical protein
MAISAGDAHNSKGLLGDVMASCLCVMLQQQQQGGQSCKHTHKHTRPPTPAAQWSFSMHAALHSTPVYGSYSDLPNVMTVACRETPQEPC